MSDYTLRRDDGLIMVTLTGRLDFDTISALLDELDSLAVAAFPTPDGPDRRNGRPARSAQRGTFGTGSAAGEARPR